MMNKGECMVLFNTVMDTQLALGRDRLGREGEEERACLLMNFVDSFLLI